MSRPVAALVALTGLVGFLVGLVVASTSPRAGVVRVEKRTATANPFVLSPSPNQSVIGPDGIDFATVVQSVNRAVVNVNTASRGSSRPRRAARYSTDDDTAPREGSGSGFVIDASGFVLTNHHVVAGADRVTVTLSDGRVFRAETVGSDATLDVALLKVEPDEPLPVANLGDSTTLRVGEWVCAIGNPLGVYVHSVTVGVVSYLGRKLFDQALDAYIQTDAAISVGNSGGPLINAAGDVVGITTAVHSQAASLGFAVPISDVIAVLPQLKAEGRVSRGELGASVRTLTTTVRRALRIEPPAGALVQDVQDGGPAARAGLRPYDVITALDGLDVQSDDELIRRVADTAPGSVARLGVWRDGNEIVLPVRLGVRPVAETARRPEESDPIPNPGRTPLGFGIRELTADLAGRLALPAGLQGVVITEVDPAGPARQADLRTNLVVTEIRRVPVRSVADFHRLVGTVRSGEPLALQVYDRAVRQYRLTVIIPEEHP